MRVIQRCLAGDQDAWAQIVRQHWRKVFNIAYKFTGKHDEAEDLTQDVFLKIFKSLNTFDRRANFQTWLVSVSRNLCIDHYRSVRKERETIDRDVDAGELTPAAHDDEPDSRRSSSATASSCSRRRWASCRRRCDRPCCCATSRSCRIRRLPTGCTCRKARSNPASIAAAPSWRGRFAGCGTSWNDPSTGDWSRRMNLTTEQNPGVAIVRVGETRMMYPLLADFSGAVAQLLASGHRKVLLDFSKVTYVDSATIGCLMDLYRQTTAAGGTHQAGRRPEARRNDARR